MCVGKGRTNDFPESSGREHNINRIQGHQRVSVECNEQLSGEMGEDEAENIDWDGTWRNTFCCGKDEVAGSASSLQAQEHALPYLKRD